MGNERAELARAPERSFIRSTFRSLRHRNFRLWWFSQLFSLVGTWMQVIALNWLVYRITGSSFCLGLVNSIAIIPSAPFFLLGGSFADRFPKKKILFWAQGGMMVQAFLLALLTWTGAVAFWHVLLLSVLMGLAQAIDWPTRQSFVAEMVGQDDLSNAIALNSSIFNLARMLGPAISGILLLYTGEALIFFINGVTFLGVLISLGLIEMREEQRSDPPLPLAAHLMEGLRYLGRNKLFIGIVSLMGFSAFCAWPYLVLLPVVAKEVFQGRAEVYSLFMGAVGTGALAGALFVASLKPSARKGAVLSAGTLAFPFLLVLFSLSKTIHLSLFLLFLAGFFFVVQNSLANTLLQVRAPQLLRARVISIFVMVVMAMMRLGALQAGIVADGLGAPLTVGLGSFFALLFALVVLCSLPGLRRMR